jgi:uncharacterized protein YlbG (UPF0298 family)
MISLFKLILEGDGNPKGIILAGGAGVGKSYVVKNLLGNLDEKTEVFTPKGSSLKFKYLNVDNFVEKKGLSLGQAQGEFRGEFQSVQDQKENILWDTTGVNIENTTSQMSGYDRFMVMVYTHPIISILQNAKRDRKLPLEAVVKTWEKAYSNVEEYKNLFGENFVLVNNQVPGYEKQVAEFNKAVSGGKENLKQYLTDLVSNNEEQFKSSFSKEFEFDTKEIEQAFNNALPKTSFDEKKDVSILKDVKKEFQKDYLKKNEDPGFELLEKRVQSKRKTKATNNQNYNDDLEGIVNKLTSSDFKKIIEPASETEIKSKFNSFLNK